jgi:hypothetical protein
MRDLRKYLRTKIAELEKECMHRNGTCPINYGCVAQGYSNKDCKEYCAAYEPEK